MHQICLTKGETRIMTEPLPDAPWITHYDEYRNDAYGLRDPDVDRLFRRHWEDTLRGEIYDEPEENEEGSTDDEGFEPV